MSLAVPEKTGFGLEVTVLFVGAVTVGVLGAVVSIVKETTLDVGLIFP